MRTTSLTSDDFARSVFAVPPLCRNNQGEVDAEQNTRLIRFLEDGGIRMLLYGGNANFYHIRYTEYHRTLEILAEAAGDETAVVPSAGPAYGLMMDQADVLREFNLPTTMVLPTTAVMTEPGLMNGFRQFVERVGKPAVLYIKDDNYISPDGAAELVRDGLVSLIKYAIVRDDPADDPFLEQLRDRVSGDLICSGIGEQPALVHMTKFGLMGYTSGCVCVNPSLSQRMLRAIGEHQADTAEDIRRSFVPLEDLRNNINPIRVLHQAVELAGIAETGNMTPLLSGVAQSAVDEIRRAANDLKLIAVPD